MSSTWVEEVWAWFNTANRWMNWHVGTVHWFQLGDQLQTLPRVDGGAGHGTEAACQQS